MQGLAADKAQQLAVEEEGGHVVDKGLDLCENLSPPWEIVEVYCPKGLLGIARSI